MKKHLILSLIIVCLANIASGETFDNYSSKETLMKRHKEDEGPVKMKTALETLADHRILFGHHSVGSNIIEGIENLASDSQVVFRTNRAENLMTAKSSPGGLFAHFTPGKNTQPKSKVDEFSNSFQHIYNDLAVDVAFMKFCYIDFSPQSNAEDILNYYKLHFQKLIQDYPGVKFIHFTVPLVTKSNTIKDRLKRLLALPVWSDNANIVRQKYNDLLLQSYPEKDIFDLAKIESTKLNGERQHFSSHSTTVYSLVPEYTNDGGHLNELGQRIVATKLIYFLEQHLTPSS